MTYLAMMLSTVVDKGVEDIPVHDALSTPDMGVDGMTFKKTKTNKNAVIYSALRTGTTPKR